MFISSYSDILCTYNICVIIININNNNYNYVLSDAFPYYVDYSALLAKYDANNGWKIAFFKQTIVNFI